MSGILPWALLLVGLGFMIHACRALAADARGGYDIGMGAAGLFSGEWLLGSIGAAWGLTLALGIQWYWGVAMFVVLFALKGVAYKLLVALNLGKEAAAPPKEGFKDFMRRAEQIDTAAKDKEVAP